MDESPIISARQVSKTFPGQVALRDVDIDVGRGEVFGLVGQNGSGKSTLIKVLSGYHEPDPGARVSFLGREVQLPGRDADWRRRLRFIHQDLGLIDSLSTVENLGLGVGYETGRFGRIVWRAERRRAEELLARLDVEVDVNAPVGTLDPATRTAVAVVRAIQDWGDGPGLLVLDEPTTSFPPGEVERLFGLIGELTQRGAGIIFVSHRLGEVLTISDRIGLLRDGRLETTREAASLDEKELANLLAGSELEPLPAIKRAPTAGKEVAVSISGLEDERLGRLDCDVCKGEIVGFAGIPGSGREVLGELLVGLRPALAGSVVVDGSPIEPLEPHNAAANGICLVPADRVRRGLIMEQSIRENISLPFLKPLLRHGRIQRRLEAEEAARWIERANVVPPAPENPVATLSGGNQQKVVLAKWLRMGPRVLVLDEPTQGVDIAAKAAIHRSLIEQAEQGMTILVSSIDGAELAQLCSRVFVLRVGAEPLELLGAEVTERNIVVNSLTTDAQVA